MLIRGNVVVLLIVFAAVIVLQVFLSRAEKQWPGLVLPFLSFAYSILMLFNIAVSMGQSAAELTMMAITVILTGNIPTLILLAIYFACRNGRNKKKELDKMNIQDLD